MKLINFLLAFFIFLQHTDAQQNHFVYIQTDNKQPFYVRIGDRLLSSSSVGYIVIPKLKEGKYDLNIGFPKDEWPQQRISMMVSDNDAGYLLKNFDVRGWGLYNIQTMEVNMANNNLPGKSNIQDAKADGFADALADVVSTPSIKQSAQSNSSNGTEVKTVTNIDTVAVKTEKPESRASITYQPVKIFTSLDKSGRSMIYTDVAGGVTDTVRIFIPYNKMPVEEIKPVVSANVNTKQEAEKTGDDGKFLDIELPNPNTIVISKKDTIVKKDNVELNRQLDKPIINNNTSPEVITMINSDCKKNASGDDFFNLRKKMAAQRTAEKMTDIAKKEFRNRCYSTEQVNNLSVLFLDDKSRYDFYDAAYPHVSDTHNFDKLALTLTDEYYINRFKAMLHK